MVAKSYKHLLVKPETEKQVMDMINSIAISEEGKKLIRRWIVFEKEAEAFIDYLKKEPQANEEMLETAIYQIAWNYAKTIGMSPRHRENWSAIM